MKIKVVKMAEDKVRLEFQLGKDDWETYIKRLELYCLVHDVEEGMQTAVLLTNVSADTYTLIGGLCAPTTPKDKSFAESVKLVGEHLWPNPSEPMEATESVAGFAVRLKKLSLQFNFAGLQSALRDRFICGLTV